MERNIYKIGKELFITSDEEIKEGDYGLSKLNEIIKFHSGYDYRYYKKIILTTDQDLIKDNVHAIDDEFLEWFVKNPTCEEVKFDSRLKVSSFQKGFLMDNPNYNKITIQKEESIILTPEDIRKVRVSYLESKQETLVDITEQIQMECHNFVESVPTVSYQDY